MARSLNKVQLIGNLTRDPEMRYTPAGTAVCTFGVATNRQWVTDAGEKKEDAEFHRIVSWNKLAEICSQLLKKGRKVYIEGRLQTRSWTGQDGAQRSSTEIVASDMVILDSRKDFAAGGETAESFDIPESALESQVEPPHPVEASGNTSSAASPQDDTGKKASLAKKSKKSDDSSQTTSEGEDSEDIPF